MQQDVQEVNYLEQILPGPDFPIVDLKLSQATPWHVAQFHLEVILYTLQPNGLTVLWWTWVCFGGLGSALVHLCALGCIFTQVHCTRVLGYARVIPAWLGFTQVCSASQMEYFLSSPFWEIKSQLGFSCIHFFPKRGWLFGASSKLCVTEYYGSYWLLQTKHYT